MDDFAWMWFAGFIAGHGSGMITIVLLRRAVRHR
jgi:hypothetical protein